MLRIDFALVVPALVVCLFTPPADAEFYRWTDDSGRQRISNIAPQGLDQRGRIRQQFHPNSIHQQHSTMREKLRRQAERLADNESDNGSERAASNAPKVEW